MDILTQSVLGAAVAPLILRDEPIRKTILFGAVIGIIPDLDMFLGFFSSDYNDLVVHRSFSHAIVPFILLGLALTWSDRHLKILSGSTERTKFIALFGVLLSHALLDCLTTWGTQLFWPFPIRVATQTVFVIDLLYSIPLAFFVYYAWQIRREIFSRQLLRIGLIVSSLYLATLFIHQQILITKYKGEGVLRVNTQSRLFSPFNYGMVLEYDDHFKVSRNTVSAFDDLAPVYYEIQKNRDVLEFLDDKMNLKALRYVSRDYLSVEIKEDGDYFIQDLRYGPINSDYHEYHSSFVYNVSSKNGKYQFTQEMRTAEKLVGLVELILVRVGIIKIDDKS